MLITNKEKQLLIQVLKKEQRRLFVSKEDKNQINQLLDKLEQTYRNEKVNKVKSSKL